MPEEPPSRAAAAIAELIQLTSLVNQSWQKSDILTREECAYIERCQEMVLIRKRLTPQLRRPLFGLLRLDHLEATIENLEHLLPCDPEMIFEPDALRRWVLAHPDDPLAGRLALAYTRTDNVLDMDDGHPDDRLIRELAGRASAQLPQSVYSPWVIWTWLVNNFDDPAAPQMAWAYLTTDHYENNYRATPGQMRKAEQLAAQYFTQNEAARQEPGARRVMNHIHGLIE